MSSSFDSSSHPRLPLLVRGHLQNIAMELILACFRSMQSCGMVNASFFHAWSLLPCLMQQAVGCKPAWVPTRLTRQNVLIMLLQAFDELLLLQRGGCTLYFGEMGKDSKSLIDYFQNLGADPIEEGYNPATWVLEQTTASKEEENNVNFAEAFQKSETARYACCTYWCHGSCLVICMLAKMAPVKGVTS